MYFVYIFVFDTSIYSAVFLITFDFYRAITKRFFCSKEIPNWKRYEGSETSNVPTTHTDF